MTEKENPNHIIYHLGCLYNNSKPECKSCDGFGNNLDNKVKMYECYMTKNMMEEFLDVKNYPLKD